MAPLPPFEQQQQQPHPFAADTPYDSATAPPQGNYPPQGSADPYTPQGLSSYPSAAAVNYPPTAYPPTNTSTATATADATKDPPIGATVAPGASAKFYAYPPYHAPAAGHPVTTAVPQMSVAPPAAFTYSQQGNEPCQCTLGWVLFGIGFVFPVCWIIGALLPFFSRNKNDKRAAIGSGVLLTVYIISIVVVAVVVVSVAAREENQTYSYRTTG